MIIIVDWLYFFQIYQDQSVFMEICINCVEFLMEFVFMQGIVECKLMILVLLYIFFKVKDGKLYIVVIDFDVLLMLWCDVVIDCEGVIVVQVCKFFEIVCVMVGDEVYFVEEDNYGLCIILGKLWFKICGFLLDDFLMFFEVGDGVQIELLYGDFCKMISKIFFVVFVEEFCFQLNGVLFKLKFGLFEMVVIDGYCLVLVEMLVVGVEESDGVFVLCKVFQELQCFDGDDVVVFCCGEYYLLFGVGWCELICWIFEGIFFDYEKVILKDNDKVVVFFCKGFGEVVSCVVLLIGDWVRVVCMVFEDQQFVVFVVNFDFGEVVEEIECEYVGLSFEFGINLDYFGQFFLVVEFDDVLFKLKDENSQCIGVLVEEVEGE